MSETNLVERLDTLVDERLRIVTDARRVLGPAWRQHGKTNREIMLEAIEVTTPSLLERARVASDDFVRGVFRAAIAAEQDRS